MSADDHARGFRDYAVERHVGQVADTLGILAHAPGAGWRALRLGPVRSWSPELRTRAAAAELLLEHVGTSAP